MLIMTVKFSWTYYTMQYAYMYPIYFHTSKYNSRPLPAVLPPVSTHTNIKYTNILTYSTTANRFRNPTDLRIVEICIKLCDNFQWFLFNNSKPFYYLRSLVAEVQPHTHMPTQNVGMVCLCGL